MYVQAHTYRLESYLPINSCLLGETQWKWNSETKMSTKMSETETWATSHLVIQHGTVTCKPILNHEIRSGGEIQVTKRPWKISLNTRRQEPYSQHLTENWCTEITREVTCPLITLRDEIGGEIRFKMSNKLSLKYKDKLPATRTSRQTGRHKSPGMLPVH